MIHALSDTLPLVIFPFAMGMEGKMTNWEIPSFCTAKWNVWFDGQWEVMSLIIWCAKCLIKLHIPKPSCPAQWRGNLVQIRRCMNAWQTMPWQVRSGSMYRSLRRGSFWIWAHWWGSSMSRVAWWRNQLLEMWATKTLAIYIIHIYEMLPIQG